MASATNILEVGALLWQTGDPLNIAVRDCFRALGYAAELTPPGATFDVRVALDGNRRLLIEVTGIEGAVNKSSGKISQVFQTCQMEANEEDRVILAANCYRSRPLAERQGLQAITSDAMRLVARLGANFVATSALFQVWVAYQQDRQQAQAMVEEFYAAEGEAFNIAPGTGQSLLSLRSPTTISFATLRSLAAF